MHRFAGWPFHAILVALPLLCVPHAPGSAQAADTPPQFVRAWGKLGTGPGEFTYPAAIEVNALGNVYVADTGNDRIQVFSSTGEFLFTWGSRGSGPGQFYSPQGIAFDPSGNVYVTDYQNYRVQKFTPEGQFLLSFGEGGTADGQFGRTNTSYEGPYGIAVDGNGDVYVGDQGNNRVQKFTGSGQFLTKWGSYGTGTGQFNDDIRGIAVDAAGNVYVTDPENNNTQEFTSYGIYVRSYVNGAYDRPMDAAVPASGRLAVLTSACVVENFQASGLFESSWGGCGDSLGQFTFPHAVSFDTKGNAFVADTYNHRIQQFSGDFVPVKSTTWGSIKAIYR